MLSIRKVSHAWRIFLPSRSRGTHWKNFLCKPSQISFQFASVQSKPKITSKYVTINHMCYILYLFCILDLLHFILTLKIFHQCSFLTIWEKNQMPSPFQFPRYFSILCVIYVHEKRKTQKQQTGEPKTKASGEESNALYSKLSFIGA